MNCPFITAPDPFLHPRTHAGVLATRIHGEDITMILRHEDVRRAAKDWAVYSSDAPFRVPVPSEEHLRSVRQLPIETNPPEHTDYRKIVEPFFQRAKDPTVIARVDALVERLFNQALQQDYIDVVQDFALPLQSIALTYLLNVPENEADTWIGWGTHVFKDPTTGEPSGAALDAYLTQQFDLAEANPEASDGFFHALTKATFRGRLLTRDECMGFANLAFAGGRDTVIHTIASIMHHLGQHPADLAFLKEDPSRITLAGEEFFRVFMPLTHIGRVCPAQTQVYGTTVPAGSRVSLGWASANRDAAAFPEPDAIKLDRKPNPHLSFGFGPHLCLGAPHARLLVRTVLAKSVEKLASIQILESHPHVETEADYTRTVGFTSLLARFR